jgi:hypothetical protein
MGIRVEPFAGNIVSISEYDTRDDLVEYRRKHHGHDPK